MSMHVTSTMCVLALLEFVTSTKLRTFEFDLNEDLSDKYAKLSYLQHRASIACLLPEKSIKEKQLTFASPKVSDDYVDWLVLRSKNTIEENPLNIRRRDPQIGPQIRLDRKEISNSLKLESETNAPVLIGRADESESEEYVVPRKVNRQYTNNVIDVKKYIRPKIVYMQGPSRIIPAGSLRRSGFLPKRYRYDQDFSKLNTFWNNGYRWEI